MTLIITICLILILWVLYDIGMKLQDILALMRNEAPAVKKPNAIARHLNKRKGKSAKHEDAA